MTQHSITFDTNTIHEPRTQGPLLLSIEETTTALGISRWQFYRMVWEQELRTITIGRRRLVPVQSLQEFINARLEKENPHGETQLR